MSLFDYTVIMTEVEEGPIKAYGVAEAKRLFSELI
jgi:hypothetical protein